MMKAAFLKLKGKTPVAMTLALLLFASCTSVTVRIESEPGAAEVRLEGKNIGVTPLDLNSANYKAEFAKPFLNITLDKPNYQTQNLLISTKANQTLRLNLKAFTAEFFDKFVLLQFQAPANAMIREALQIQGFIVANQAARAEEKNKEFLQKYPNVAAGYVLQASIELSRGNRDLALRNLQRANGLDPSDSTIVRMIENIKGGTR